MTGLITIGHKFISTEQYCFDKTSKRMLFQFGFVIWYMHAFEHAVEYKICGVGILKLLIHI